MPKSTYLKYSAVLPKKIDGKAFFKSIEQDILSGITEAAVSAIKRSAYLVPVDTGMARNSLNATIQTWAGARESAYVAWTPKNKRPKFYYIEPGQRFYNRVSYMIEPLPRGSKVGYTGRIPKTPETGRKLSEISILKKTGNTFKFTFMFETGISHFIHHAGWGVVEDIKERFDTELQQAIIRIMRRAKKKLKSYMHYVTIRHGVEETYTLQSGKITL